MTETVAGIEYSKPTVILLQETGIGTAEYAARTCYDSFDASENEAVKILNETLPEYGPSDNIQSAEAMTIAAINDIEHSDLLDKLAWTHFHHSILEHANLTFLIKGTPRGVLQEQARHRIQSLSVRSTRYTMSSVINAFVACKFTILEGPGYINTQYETFIELVSKLDLFVATDTIYNELEIRGILHKLNYQFDTLGAKEFYNIATPKSSTLLFEEAASIGASPRDFFEALEAGKKKRNVGDAFKHIVTDNWKVDMVVTMNLRALKNYLDLRDSGAAYFQIRWLAQAIKDATPSKYLDLIVKK